MRRFSFSELLNFCLLKTSLLTLFVVLISASPVFASIQMVELRFPIPIEKTKGTMAGMIKGNVGEASENCQKFLSRNQFRVDFVFRKDMADFTSEKCPTARIYDLRVLFRDSRETIRYIISDFLSKCAYLCIVCGRCNESVDIRCKIERRLAPRVQIWDRYFNVFSYSGNGVEPSPDWANPSTIRRNESLIDCLVGIAGDCNKIGGYEDEKESRYRSHQPINMIKSANDIGTALYNVAAPTTQHIATIRRVLGMAIYLTFGVIFLASVAHPFSPRMFAIGLVGALLGWCIGDLGSALSAFADCCTENVRVQTVVIAELELGDIERKVLFADLVEGSDHAAFDQRPEALNRVRVNGADDVLAVMMVNRPMRVGRAEVHIALPLVGAEKADFGRDGFVDEAGESGRLGVGYDTGDDASLAAHGAGNDRFADSWAAGTNAAVTVALMPVLSLPADECLIDLDNAGELFEILVSERDAYAMAHGPCGFVAAEADEAIDLQGAHTLLAGQHQVNDAKPVFERLVGVLEDRPGNVREAIAGLTRAFVALPMVRVVLERGRIFSATARAANAFRPTLADQICATRLFVREHRIELRSGQLVDRLVRFVAGHSVNFPSMETL